MYKKILATSALIGAAMTANVGNAFCLFNCDYTKTKYPIVLAPGVLGFDKLVGFVDYWYGIPGALRDGGAKVYTTSASAFNSSEVRGEQLLKQTQNILAITGAAKVNLMGHSHGGYSVRYVADAIPTRVASLTLIHSPVKGAGMADVIRNVAPSGTFSASVVQSVGTAVAGIVTFLAGNSYKEDFMASMDSFTKTGSGTLTLDFRPHDNVLFRLEGRYDTANFPLFYRGQVPLADPADPQSYVTTAGSQATVLAGMTTFF